MLLALLAVYVPYRWYSRLILLSFYCLLLPCNRRFSPLAPLAGRRPGPSPPAVPLSHAALGAWLLHAPARVVSVRGAMRSLAFVGGPRVAEALYLPSECALAWILTASRQRRLI